MIDGDSDLHAYPKKYPLWFSEMMTDFVYFNDYHDHQQIAMNERMMW